MVPKLTRAHIEPTDFEKMRVYLACQTLSHSVASALGISILDGSLPTSAAGTLEFIERIFNPKIYSLSTGKV